MGNKIKRVVSDQAKELILGTFGKWCKLKQITREVMDEAATIDENLTKR